MTLSSVGPVSHSAFCNNDGHQFLNHKDKKCSYIMIHMSILILRALTVPSSCEEVVNLEISKLN